MANTMEMEIVNGRTPTECTPVQKIKFCVVDEGATVILPGHESIIALGEKNSLEIDGIPKPILQSFLVYSKNIEGTTHISIIISEITEK